MHSICDCLRGREEHDRLFLMITRSDGLFAETSLSPFYCLHNFSAGTLNVSENLSHIAERHAVINADRLCTHMCGETS